MFVFACFLAFFVFFWGGQEEPINNNTFTTIPKDLLRDSDRSVADAEKHSLVLASDVLSELPTDLARKTALMLLWNLTAEGGFLVISEQIEFPGWLTLIQIETLAPLDQPVEASALPVCSSRLFLHHRKFQGSHRAPRARTAAGLDQRTRANKQRRR